MIMELFISKSLLIKVIRLVPGRTFPHFGETKLKPFYITFFPLLMTHEATL